MWIGANLRRHREAAAKAFGFALERFQRFDDTISDETAENGENYNQTEAEHSHRDQQRVDRRIGFLRFLPDEGVPPFAPEAGRRQKMIEPNGSGAQSTTVSTPA